MSRVRGFTLVELLIVMAIILLLLALLFPAARGAWDLALMMRCRNNLRQLCLAMTSFANDNDGRLPGGEHDQPSLEWIGNPNTIGSERSNLWRCPQQGSLFPYVGNEKVYMCPKDEQSTAEDTRARGGPLPLEPGTGLGNGRFSYSMSAILAGASLALLGQCRSEYTDLDGNPQGMAVALLVEEDPEHWLGYGYPDGSWCNIDEFSDRHFGGCNIGYIDGHVEHRQMSPIMTSWDLTLVMPKGKISFGTMGLNWESGLDDWHGRQ
ncbi:MAG: prepilin-type N-terminal cleavage/methylation domain-containing protein [Phycisphaerae bacterium]|nr:prepilin-type N-terminal cleavage/methylation domain-containing protein [Phycisphaerae bacterium]